MNDMQKFVNEQLDIVENRLKERIEKLEKEHKGCFFHLEEGKINLEWYTNVDKELSELKVRSAAHTEEPKHYEGDRKMKCG